MTFAQADLLDAIVHESIHQLTGGCAAYVLVVVCPEERAICVRSSCVADDEATALLREVLQLRTLETGTEVTH